MFRIYFSCFYIVTLIFVCTFIGDKSVLGISLFYPFWILVLVFRRSISIGEIVAQLVLILLSPLFLRGVITTSQPEYYNFFFMAIGYINVIPLFFIVLNECSKQVVIRVCVGYMCFFGIGLLASTFLLGARGGFVFGPNVLYRILSFFFAFSLISMMTDSTKQHSKFSVYLLWIIFAVFMCATLSRGAIVVLFIFSILFLFTRKGERLLIACFAILFSVILIYVAKDSHLISRLLYFDLANNSEAYRFSKYVVFLDFFNTDDLFFGLTNDNYMGMYPHNFILELVYFFGFIPCVLLMLASFPSLFCKDFYLLVFLMLGVILGSMLSGDMLYNFPVISIMLTALISLDRERCKKIKVNYEF